MKRFSTTHSTLNVSLSKRFYAFVIVQIIPTTEILHNIYLCILMCADHLNPEYGSAGRHWYMTVCSMPTINCAWIPHSRTTTREFLGAFSTKISRQPFVYSTTCRSGGVPLALQWRSPEFSQKARLEQYCDRLRGHSRNNCINLTKVIFIHNNHMYVIARTVNAIEY